MNAANSGYIGDLGGQWIPELLYIGAPLPINHDLFLVGDAVRLDYCCPSDQEEIWRSGHRRISDDVLILGVVVPISQQGLFDGKSQWKA